METRSDLKHGSARGAKKRPEERRTRAGSGRLHQRLALWVSWFWQKYRLADDPVNRKRDNCERGLRWNIDEAERAEV